MARTALFVLIFALSRNASADCDLRYAPAEVRAAALAFHHQASERHPSHANNAVRAAMQQVPRVEHPNQPSAIARVDRTPAR
jgi:hypothetical protein